MRRRATASLAPCVTWHQQATFNTVSCRLWKAKEHVSCTAGSYAEREPNYHADVPVLPLWTTHARVVVTRSGGAMLIADEGDRETRIWIMPVDSISSKLSLTTTTP